MTERLPITQTGAETIGADFSPCRRYRYTLRRRIAEPVERWYVASWPDVVLFVMLNPSTADERLDDPTVRRCHNFARGWGAKEVAVCNLFAFRATDPRAMKREPDPVGPENDEWIYREAKRADLIVCAWGNHGTHRERDREVLAILQCVAPDRTRALQLSNKGNPKHPLYLAGQLEPVRFQPWLT